MTVTAAPPNAPLFGYQAFMRLWFSRVAGTSASQMLMVAIGWQMYGLTGSPWDLGLVGLLRFLPALLLVLFAGHVVDRFHRARIVMLCLLVQTLIAAALAVSAHRAGTSRELLLALSVLLGSVSAVNSVFIGASNQLGEFESGATAALLGPVGAVLLGGLGTLLVAGLWFRLFPALANRDALSGRR